MGRARKRGEKRDRRAIRGTRDDEEEERKGSGKKEAARDLVPKCQFLLP